MNKNNPTILGISLGTREIGFVVFRNGEFLNWGIKTYKEKWSQKKMENILEDITEIITKYKVTHLTLKVPLPHTSSVSLMTLTNALEQLAKDNSITVYKYSLKELLKQCSGKMPILKKSIVNFITQKFPAFSVEQKKEVYNSIPYYIKIFEAAAAVDVALPGMLNTF